MYAGLVLLKNLELSDTDVGSNGIRHLSGKDSILLAVGCIVVLIVMRLYGSY